MRRHITPRSLQVRSIELEAHSVDVLGKVYSQLPFEIMTSKEIREDVRLKYRYLDLRNQKVKDNIIFRSNVIAFLRQKMTEMGFFGDPDSYPYIIFT